ncbi:MAG: leucine-rich repeat domain-containing protein [Bacillota bacterium]
MKKGIKMTALLPVVLLCILYPAVAAATGGINITVGDTISVIVDGERLSFDGAVPFIEEGRTMVPMAAIFKALGASVVWDGATRTVTAKRGETVVVLEIDKKTALINGKPETLDAPARLVSGRTFVPLRFVSQAFGAQATWDSLTRTINISRPVRVTSLTLVPAQLSLRSGQTAQVAVTAHLGDGKQERVEAGEVSWRSSNTAVATVEGGVVTGAGPGNTVITVAYGGASGVIAVKVDESLSGIALTPATLSLEMGDSSDLALLARYTGQEQQTIPGNRASWRTSNGNVATVREGRVTAVAPGTVTITATFHTYQATAIVEVFRNMPVEFRDVELLAAIRVKLNKPVGPLYRSELAALTELIASDRLIEDLSGIEYCTNLRTLSLANNHIRDISPLARLTALQRLELSYNQVSNLAPLAGLQNLSWLSINNNRVSDISALANLTGLRWLSLAGNDVSDITALASLQNMRTLNLSVNRISSLNALADMKGLVTLSCWSNQISSISPLAGLPNLTTLNAWSNNISSITPLTGLPDLSWLVIGDNPLELSAGSPAMAEIRSMRSRGVFVRTEAF